MLETEYETTEFLEMTFLSFRGFPYELDKENPNRVKAIFKGDLKQIALIKSLLNEFWGDSRDRKLMNRMIQMKRELWVGGKFDPNFKSRKNESKECQE